MDDRMRRSNIHLIGAIEGENNKNEKHSWNEKQCLKTMPGNSPGLKKYFNFRIEKNSRQDDKSRSKMKQDNEKGLKTKVKKTKRLSTYRGTTLRLAEDNNSRW